MVKQRIFPLKSSEETLFLMYQMFLCRVVNPLTKVEASLEFVFCNPTTMTYFGTASAIFIGSGLFS